MFYLLRYVELYPRTTQRAIHSAYDFYCISLNNYRRHGVTRRRNKIALGL